MTPAFCTGHHPLHSEHGASTLHTPELLGQTAFRACLCCLAFGLLVWPSCRRRPHGCTAQDLCTEDGACSPNLASTAYTVEEGDPNILLCLHCCATGFEASEYPRLFGSHLGCLCQDSGPSA